MGVVLLDILLCIYIYVVFCRSLFVLWLCDCNISSRNKTMCVCFLIYLSCFFCVCFSLFLLISLFYLDFCSITILQILSEITENIKSGKKSTFGKNRANISIKKYSLCLQTKYSTVSSHDMCVLYNTLLFSVAATHPIVL